MIATGKRGERRAGVWRILIVAAAMAIGSVLTAARVPPGQERPVSVLEGAYTESQAERGRQVYRETCTTCHAPNEFTGAVFDTWVGQPLERFFSLIRSTMPEDNAAGLSGEQYADLVAYILELNGYPAGNGDLPSDRAILSQIRLEDRPPSVEDDSVR